MEIISTPLEGLLILKPAVFADDRGYFFESYSWQKLAPHGLDAPFVQDNESKSMKHVLRGLHFQRPPFAQGKLVRVVQGSVLDVAVDLRQGSSTYGRSFSLELTGQSKWMLWIPEGFAHGFLTLADDTVFFYKCTRPYQPSAEGCLRWNDPDLKIDWGIEEPRLSQRDAAAPWFKDFVSPF